MPEFMNAKNLTENELVEALTELSDQVTKKHKYQACIDLGKGGVPVDIRTVDDCLKGKVRNTEFGNALLQYFIEKGYTLQQPAA